MNSLTHAEVEAGDLIDRYCAHTLDEPTSAAVEAHYFACDACFAAVQEIDALRGAIRAAAQDGTLAAEPGLAPLVAPRRANSRALVMTWMPAAAAVVLAAGLGWMSLVRMPALRTELAATTADRDSLNARLKAAVPTPAAPPAAADGNVPMVALASERGAADVPAIVVSASAARFIVMIDAPASPSGRAELTIQSAAGQEVAAVHDLVRNSSGVWVVSLSTPAFPPGTYRFRLSAAAPGALLGDYLLKVTR